MVYINTGEIHFIQSNQLKLARSGAIVPTKCLQASNTTSECEQYYTSQMNNLVPNFLHFQYFIIKDEIFTICNESLLIEWGSQKLTCGHELTQFLISSLPAKVTLASGYSYFIKDTDFLSKDYEKFDMDFHFLPPTFDPIFLDYNEGNIIMNDEDYDTSIIPDIQTFFQKNQLFRNLSIGSICTFILVVLTCLIILICCVPSCSKCLEYMFCCCRNNPGDRLRALYSPPGRN